MATIDLGRLGFVNKGTYNNSTTYEKNDLVQFTDGGILSTYLYIDSTAQSGQAPSSSGTAGSRWVYFAKGVADAIASAGNNKVLVTDGSGGLSPLSIGSAGQSLKVNSGANGFEFGTISSGDVSQVATTNTQTFNDQNNWTTFTGLSLAVTPSSTSTKLLILLNTYANLNSSQGWGLRIKQDGTVVATQKNRYATYQGAGGDHEQNHFTAIVSPSTTSSITFTVEVKNNNNSNITMNDGDNSRMTIVEIG